MAEKIKIGRRGGSTVALTHAFCIERKTDGGIRLSEIQSMTDSEQAMILAHFGRTQRVILGVGGEQHYRTLKPGSEQHFYAAVSEIPWPFGVMSGAA